MVKLRDRTTQAEPRSTLDSGPCSFVPSSAGRDDSRVALEAGSRRLKEAGSGVEPSEGGKRKAESGKRSGAGMRGILASSASPHISCPPSPAARPAILSLTRLVKAQNISTCVYPPVHPLTFVPITFRPGFLSRTANPFLGSHLAPCNSNPWPVACSPVFCTPRGSTGRLHPHTAPSLPLPLFHWLDINQFSATQIRIGCLNPHQHCQPHTPRLGPNHHHVSPRLPPAQA